MDMARTVPDEERFLAFARDRDARALEELLRAHADSAYTQAYRMLGNAADADDALQEAFLQLARGARSYDPAIPFRAWLGRLVHIAALRVRRADRRRERRQHEAASRRSEATVMDDDIDHEQVRRAVAELPESYRAPIDLHYFGGLSQGDTARALGLSENAVAVRIHRGRERLRQALGGTQPIATGVVVAALGGAPAHAAPAATAAHAATIAGWAAHGALPATTVKLSLIQQGAWFMSQHPLAAGAIAATLATAALVAPLAHAAEGSRQDTPAPRAPAPTVKAAADDASREWWTGRAGALLPFIDPQSTVRLGIDLDALRAAGAEAPPTAMLRDPRLARTVAHIRHQLEIWPRDTADVAPILSWFDGVHGLATSWLLEGDSHARNESGLVIVDAGGTIDSLREYFDRTEIQRRNRQAADPGTTSPKAYAPSTIGPFTGQAADGQILAVDHERFVAATESVLRHALDQPGKPEPRWRAAPLWLEFEPARLDAYARIATSVPGGWESLKPTLAIALTPGREGWHGTTSITGGHRPPLGSIGPVGAGALASAKLAGIAVAFGSGDDLGAAIAMAPSGDALAALKPICSTFLTGEVAICADPGAPLPQLSLIAALRPDADRGELPKLLDPVLQQLGGTPDVKQPMWTVMSPLGQVTVLIAEDRLVITTAPDPKPLLARGAAMSESVAAQADLAALGRAYLPLLYAAVPARPVFLEGQEFPRAIGNLGFLRDHLVIQIVQDGGKTIGSLISGPAPTFNGSMLNDLRRVLASCGVDDIDASVALFTDWQKQGDLQKAHHALLYRLADGWHEASSSIGRESLSPALTLEQARKLVAGLRQVSGAPLEAVKPIAAPELATFDRRWLPDIAAVCDHLPRWRLAARCADDGFVVEEEGVPLVALAGLAAPTWAAGARPIETEAVPVPAPAPASAPQTKEF
jgi:RNA polymerase sigma-70 factor (ECF subfamily)